MKVSFAITKVLIENIDCLNIIFNIENKENGYKLIKATVSMLA